MLSFDKCLLFCGGNMSGNKVKIMSQGAMLASLFGVLGLINIYTGSIFDNIFSYIMVLALAYYAYLYDYKAALSGIKIVDEKIISSDLKYVCDYANLKENSSKVSFIYQQAFSPHLASRYDKNFVDLSKILC